MILTANDTGGSPAAAQSGGFLTAARMLLYALLIVTPLARGSVEHWAVTLIHIITLAALTLVGLYFILNSTGRAWDATPLWKPVLAVIALTALSAAFSVYRPDSFRALLLLVNYVAVFYLVIFTASDRRHLMQLIYVIIGVAVFLCVFGFVKKFGQNPFPWWNYPEIGSGSLASTYGNRDHLAGYLEMAIPLLMGVMIADLTPVVRSFLLYLLALLLTTQVLTLSRGGWCATAAALLFMAGVLMTNRHYRRKKRLAIITGTVIFMALVVSLNTSVVERILTLTEARQDASMEGRVDAWKGCIAMVADYPLVGVGPGDFALAFTRYQPPGFDQRFTYAHNDYLQAISEDGLLLIPMVIWMLVVLYRRGFAKLKSPSRLVRGTTLGALSGVTAILVHSFVDFNLSIPANALLFAVLSAIVVVSVSQNKRSRYRHA